MSASLQFFDMSVTVTPPGGHLQPQPITLGPNWQPNDVRLLFVSASAKDISGGGAHIMGMLPDPPTNPNFTAVYSLNVGVETHGVYYRRLVADDNDTYVSWTKPANWQHFMFATVTVRGVSPTANPTAGTLSPPGPGISYTTADTTTGATVNSVTVPGAGCMVFFLGDVAAPSLMPWPNWPVSLGCPPGWTNLVATQYSGANYYPYDTEPNLIVVAKTYTSAGSTGSVVFPAGQGSPAFSGLYAFLTPGADVSATIGAA